MQDELQSIIGQLSTLQNPDGSFNNCEENSSCTSGLATAHVLTALNYLIEQKNDLKVETLAATNNIRGQAANYLLSQRTDNWTFRSQVIRGTEATILNNDLHLAFEALTALHGYDQNIFDGEAMAGILKLLIKCESQAGGPYYSLLETGEIRKVINPAVNLSIARFLKTQNVELEALVDLLGPDLELTPNNPDYYSSHLADSETQPPANRLIFKLLGHLTSNGSQVLPSEASTGRNAEEYFYTQIISKAEADFNRLPAALRPPTEQMLARIIKADKDQQIVLLPYFFRQALGPLGESIDDDLIIELGQANALVWMAYTIYDDFLDDEGQVKLLSTANYCLRHYTAIFESQFKQDDLFIKAFHSIMDQMDNVNAWEVSECRAKITGKILTLPGKLPDYQEFKLLSQKSLPHCLGPLAILNRLGFAPDSPAASSTLDFFDHYLIARQLDDDAHDWEDDLARGQLSSVVTLILKDYHSSIELSLESLLPQLRQAFAFDHLPIISRFILTQLEMAKMALDKAGIISDPARLLKLLEPHRHSANKALVEHGNFNQLIKAWGNRKEGK